MSAEVLVLEEERVLRQIEARARESERQLRRDALLQAMFVLERAESDVFYASLGSYAPKELARLAEHMTAVRCEIRRKLETL